MKYLILPAFALLFPVITHAELIQDRIAKVLPGNSAGKESLILLAETGRVLRTKNLGTTQVLAEKTQNSEGITFVVENGDILSYAIDKSTQGDPVLEAYHDDTLPSFSPATIPTDIRYTDKSYAPTNFKNLSDVQKLMSQLKDNLKSRSECYQRAHLWSIEMYQMAQVKSQKVFLFFSEKYMREYRFHWWFHVAPFVLVNSQERVVDPRFFSAPMDTYSWSSNFLKNHPVCKVISHYRDYENHQQDEYCFFRKLPMYYFEPTEIENRDVSNVVISQWIDSQVSSAYHALDTAPWWKR